MLGAAVVCGMRFNVALRMVRGEQQLPAGHDQAGGTAPRPAEQVNEGEKARAVLELGDQRRERALVQGRKVTPFGVGDELLEAKVDLLCGEPVKLPEQVCGGRHQASAQWFAATVHVSGASSRQVVSSAAQPR